MSILFKTKKYLFASLLCGLFAGLMNLPTAMAQDHESTGDHGGNGGNIHGTALKLKIDEIKSFVTTKDGAAAFPEVDQELLKKNYSRLKVWVRPGEVKDKFGNPQTCINDQDTWVITCDEAKLLKEKELGKAYVITAFHELLGLLGVEVTKDKDAPTDLSVSSRLVKYLTFQIEQDWVIQFSGSQHHPENGDIRRVGFACWETAMSLKRSTSPLALKMHRYFFVFPDGTYYWIKYGESRSDKTYRVKILKTGKAKYVSYEKSGHPEPLGIYDDINLEMSEPGRPDADTFISTTSIADLMRQESKGSGGSEFEGYFITEWDHDDKEGHTTQMHCSPGENTLFPMRPKILRAAVGEAAEKEENVRYQKALKKAQDESKSETLE